MSYVSVYDSSKTEIAERAAKKIRPDIDQLKRAFTAVTDKQQEQLDRIEGQLAELLAILKPQDIVKPALVSKKAEGAKP